MIDEVKLKARAAALREALFSGLPLSDGDVIKRAVEDPRLADEDKKVLEAEFGETVGGSFLKGLGRGAGVDLLGKVLSYTPAGMAIDKVTQTLNPQAPSIGDVGKVLDSQPLQTGWTTGANIAGRVAGNIGALAVPGGPLLKAGKLGRAGFGALQGAGSISQNLGDQREEMTLGDRTEYNVPGMVASAGISAAGGALIPSVVAMQRATKGVPGSAKYIAKYAGKGAGIGGAEGAADALFYNVLESDDNLSQSGREKGMDPWSAALMGGAMGAGFGGALDALDGRKAVRQGAPTSPLPPVGHQANPVTRAATPSPQPTLQTPGYDPQRHSNLNWQGDLNQFESPAMGEAVTNTTTFGAISRAQELSEDAKKALTSKPPKQLLVDRVTGEKLPIWFDPVGKSYYGMRGGEIRRLPSSFLRKGKDRLRLIQNEAFIQPGEHKSTPKTAMQAVTIGGRAGLPISFSPSMDKVGIAWSDQMTPGGLTAAEVLDLDETIMAGSEPWKEALRRALEARPASVNQMMRPQEFDQLPKIASTDELLDVSGARVAQELLDLVNRVRQRNPNQPNLPF